MNKKLAASLIAAVVALAGGGAATGVALRERVAALEARTKNVEDYLIRIETKLDRLIERGH